MTLQHYFYLIIFVIYIVRTFLFAIRFKRSKTIYTKKQKQLHSILIWFIPFIWMFFLDTFSQSSPGSHHYSNKRDSEGFGGGQDYWGGDTGGHDSGGHH
jgi:heme/copper-type cytochrome/quinol oxidase subunit 2